MLQEFYFVHGVLIDNHLSWKCHVDYIAMKMSKIVGVIAHLRHFVSFSTLRSIYISPSCFPT